MINVVFVGEVKTTVRPGFKSRFANVDPGKKDSFDVNPEKDFIC